MQSFAFDRRGGEVLFVVKDGTIGIGPVTSARAVCIMGVEGFWTVRD